MFTAGQILQFALGYLPHAPRYVFGRFEDVVNGFAGGMAVCAFLFGSGSWFGMLLYVAMWCVIAYLCVRLAESAISRVLSRGSSIEHAPHHGNTGVPAGGSSRPVSSDSRAMGAASPPGDTLD
jgi:hypothetical protein